MGVGERVGGGITKFILQAPRNHSFRRRRVTKGNVVCCLVKTVRGHHSGSQRHGSETKRHFFEGHNDITHNTGSLVISK